MIYQAQAAAIKSAVDAFRQALGSNNGAGGSFAAGRREITWGPAFQPPPWTRLRATLSAIPVTVVVECVYVSPNHHALADQFAISDNFYCDADQSNTGHRWVVGVYPNEWVEVNARSRIEERLFSTAPGRRYVAGSSATVLPEDYNEAGALWEHLARHGRSFYNFGFGTEMPAAIEERIYKDSGVHH